MTVQVRERDGGVPVSHAVAPTDQTPIVGDLVTAAWCRSCGDPVLEPGDVCPRCGTGLVGPDHADVDGVQRLGLVVQVGRAVFKKPAVVVGDDGVAVTVVSKGEELSTLPVPEFDQMATVDVGGQRVTSAAGRLWAVVDAAAGGRLKASFALPAVDRLAWDLGRRSLAALRAAVLDRLALGLECDLRYLPLSTTEMAWYAACETAARSDTVALLERLDALPARGYGARWELLARQVPDLIADAGLRARALRAIDSATGDSLLARGLAAALRDGADVPTVDVVRYVAAVSAAGDRQLAEDLGSVGVALTAGARVPARPSSELPYVSAFDAFLAGTAGELLDGSENLLASMPLECVDELIDVGAVSAVSESFAPWAAPTTAYVRCRLAPGDVETDVLQAAGFEAELARRAYLRADRVALDALDGGDPTVRHYRALLDLRDDLAGFQAPEGLRPDTAAVVGAARATAAQARDGSAVVPTEVLADPTLWPLLEHAARHGRVQVNDPGHPTARDFVDWSELCTVQGNLFDGSWSEVITRATALADRAGHPAVSAEARNMAAFAALQLGRVDDARRLVGRDLGDTPTTGQLVNAAVVAAQRSSLDAIPHLHQILTTDPRSEVRAAAVRRAVELWRGDVDVPDYPPALAAIVRAALGAGFDDDVVVELLKVTAYQDEDWLAQNTPPLLRSQTLMAEYFQELARLHSSTTKVTFEDFCGTLATALRQTPRPSWLDAERARVVGLIDEGVHTTYGEAPAFALGAQVLIRAGALEPAEQIYLGPQAAAHIASVIEEQDGELKASVEKELVHDSVALFRRLRSDLEPAQVADLAEDAGRSTWMVALHVWGLTGRRHKELADEYNGLVQRQRWDVENRRRIWSIQKQLLRDFRSDYLDRCRGILAALDSLVTPEYAEKGVRAFRTDLRNWQTEVDELEGEL